MPGKPIQFLVLATLLLAYSCKSDRSAQETRYDVELQCETVSADDIAPESAVYALINQNKVKIATASTCQPILPEEYEHYSIPSDALAAVGGWWAGAGDYFYALEEDGVILFFHGVMSEMQEEDSFRYEKLGRFEDGRFYLQLPAAE
jgi:hypothetical protein